jgi:hypothetical protein
MVERSTRRIIGLLRPGLPFRLRLAARRRSRITDDVGSDAVGVVRGDFARHAGHPLARAAPQCNRPLRRADAQFATPAA